jgi:hypothetical protein
MLIEEKIKYVYTSKELKPLEKNLNAWVAFLRYYEKKAEEVPWYRERTHVGFFSVASWRGKIPAVEEWTIRKKNINRPGRCDLWIQNRKGDYYIEAKHIYCPITNPERTISKIRSTIEICKNHAGNLKDDESPKRQILAFTFLGAMIPKNCIIKYEELDIHKDVTNWLKYLREEIEYDAIAWYLSNRKYNGAKLDPSRNFEVGTVLLINKPELN